MIVSNAPEDLQQGDEIITRRYEFYSYVGPIDPITKEALAKKVAADGIHGINQYSNTVVVGDFLSAQMSAFNHELPIGLTENIADGQLNQPYPTRTIVISGVPFTCTNSGILPGGLNLDYTTGQLSGTPTNSGIYAFRVRVTDTNHVSLEHAYTLAITEPGEELPAHSTVDAVSYPLDSEDASGIGLYTNGSTCTITAIAKPGYRFSHWTDNDESVSSKAVYQFPISLNRSLVANFSAAPPDLHLAAFNQNSHTLSWPTNPTPCVLEETMDMHTWTSVPQPVVTVGSNATVTVPTGPVMKFYRLRLQ